MRIGKLAEMTGVSRDALRFYESIGLLLAERKENGYREYPAEVALLIEHIQTAQRLGGSLKDLQAVLPRFWQATDREAAIRNMLSEQLLQINGQIADWQALRAQISSKLAGNAAWSTPDNPS